MKHRMHDITYCSSKFRSSLISRQIMEREKNGQGQGNFTSGKIFADILKGGIRSLTGIYVPKLYGQITVCFLKTSKPKTLKQFSLLYNDSKWSCIYHAPVYPKSTSSFLLTLFEPEYHHPVTPYLLKYEIMTPTFDIFISCSALLSKGTITSLRKTFIYKVECKST